MAQTHQIMDFEPWLKPIKYWTWSHGSNLSIIELWAMAQTPKKQDIEPWLKPLKNRPLSHGSNPHLTCRFSHGDQWTSHEIQNEIISLLAKFTESKIMQQVNNKTFDQQYIGIISDETSDISRHEQISLVLSYIDSEGTKRETFLVYRWWNFVQSHCEQIVWAWHRSGENHWAWIWWS